MRLSSAKPVVVIVPGALHKPDAYPAFTNLLEERGFEVIRPSFASCSDGNLDPEVGHSDDVKNIHAELLPLLNQGRRALIVAHSYGSLPAVDSIGIQTVMERSARGLKGGVVAYVCVAGPVFPQRGKGPMGDDTKFQPALYHIIKDGIMTLSEAAIPIWFSDLSDKERRNAYDGLYKHQTFKSMTGFPQYIVSDLNIPKFYILTENDVALSVDGQEHFIAVGGFESVFRVKSGHAPFTKIPEEMANIVDQVAIQVASV